MLHGVNKTHIILITVLVVMILSCQLAFAGLISNAQQSNAINNFKQQITDAYIAVRRIILCVAAVGIAYSGVAMIAGSEKDAETAKSTIKLIVIAVVALYLLPTVIQFAKNNFFSGFAWSPESLK